MKSCLVVLLLREELKFEGVTHVHDNHLLLFGELAVRPVDHELVHLTANLHAGELRTRDGGDTLAITNTNDRDVVGAAHARARQSEIATDGVTAGLHLVLAVAVIADDVHTAARAATADEGPVDASLGHALGGSGPGGLVGAHGGLGLAAAATNAGERLGDSDEGLSSMVGFGNVNLEGTVGAATDTFHAFRSFHAVIIVTLGLAIAVGTRRELVRVFHALIGSGWVEVANVVTILSFAADEFQNLDLAGDEETALGWALGGEDGLFSTHLGKFSSL